MVWRMGGHRKAGNGSAKLLKGVLRRPLLAHWRRATRSEPD
jgi:hypothetical protein